MSNSLAAVHPELIVEWSDRNLPLTPDSVTFGSNKKVWLIRMVSLQCYSRNHNIKDNGNIGMCDEIESLLPYMALQPVQSQPTNKNIIMLLVFDWFNTQYYY